MTGASVFTSVVTFDAPDELSMCLQAIASQTVPPERVLVIDNASPEPAERTVRSLALSGLPVEVLRLAENVGPAGGHAEGLRRFVASPCSLAWVMDDDRVPEEDCLEGLLEAYEASDRRALIFPTDVGADGVSVDHPSWCGVLIPRPIVEAVGVPLDQLFWWVEDTEYLGWRIPRAGFEVRRVPSAVVRHHRSVERIRPAWKYYYETRNAVWYRRIVQGGTRNRRLRRALVRTVGRIVLVEDRKFAKLRMVVRGYRDGAAGRLGRPISVERRHDPGQG